jgi:hypothetical protein
MTRALLALFCVALLGACAAPAPQPGAAVAIGPADPACAAGERRAPGDARIRRAIDEALRQHQLFGGQTVERDGALSQLGYHEAEWSRPMGESVPSWERVATFWRALSESDPPTLATSVGRVARAEALREVAAAGGEPTRGGVAVREALLRAAIMDTPWSAAFISYLMQTAGFSRVEFTLSDSHVDYVQAAFEASAAEARGAPATGIYRACDVATTRPRAGDLLCATRAGTAGTTRFADLPAAMAARVPGAGFPMHCDLVVRADEGGDARMETMGGNVFNSVTLSRMTLDARKVLDSQYLTGADADRACQRPGRACPPHLSRRPWLVLLQFRH